MRPCIGTPPELRQAPNEPPDDRLAIGIVALFVLVISLPYLLHQ
jgi:hypothetical protein